MFERSDSYQVLADKRFDQRLDRPTVSVAPPSGGLPQLSGAGERSIDRLSHRLLDLLRAGTSRSGVDDGPRRPRHLHTPRIVTSLAGTLAQ